MIQRTMQVQRQSQKLFDSFPRIRPLDRNYSKPLRAILDDELVRDDEFAQGIKETGPARWRTLEPDLLREGIDEDIGLHAPLMGEQGRVTALPSREVFDIIREHIVEVSHPVPTGDAQLAGVANVEHTGPLAHGAVFRARIAIVLGNLPGMVFGKPCTAPGLHIVKRRSNCHHSLITLRACVRKASCEKRGQKRVLMITRKSSRSDSVRRYA